MGIIVGGNWCSVYFKATVWSSRCLYTYLWHASSHRRWRWALTWTVSTWKEAWPTRLSRAKMNSCCAPSALQTSTQSFGCTSRKGNYCTSGSRELVPLTWPASCWRVQKKWRNERERLRGGWLQESWSRRQENFRLEQIRHHGQELDRESWNRGIILPLCHLSAAWTKSCSVVFH